MSHLLIATFLHVSLAAVSADSYAEAHRQAESGKPLVILVSTDWCAPCQTMKKAVLPEVEKRGTLKKVAFTIVNPDDNKQLAQKLTRGDSAVPQLIMYRKTRDGWRRKRLIGRQSIEQVEQFIQQGISLSKKDQ